MDGKQYYIVESAGYRAISPTVEAFLMILKRNLVPGKVLGSRPGSRCCTISGCLGRGRSPGDLGLNGKESNVTR